ncbi:MAG: glycosyltransferase family 39 protein [Anaerolineales bacterium]|nr:glycosyltransferase family 39 protein [Anaerolineales bacterium]
MDRKKFTEPLIYIALIIAILAPRIPKIGSFVTLDEPSWLSQGANFYYALGQREFENTVYEYQPAVTTMWIISMGMLVYFPAYRGFGQGYLDYEKGRLDPFMYEHGYKPLMLLTYSRLIQVFVILVLFLFLYYLLQRFLPKLSAAFAVVFVAFDPYYLGLTRMLTHEAMVALFVLVSLMALAVYLLRDRRVLFLLISGAAAGFAQLTKSSSIAMLAGVGVLLLMQIIQEHQQGWGKSFLNSVKIFMLWLIFLVITYFIFWPGMWVAPGKMLYQVYGNAFSYTFQGARLTVTEDLDVSQFSLNANLAGIWSVARVVLYRTTLWTWFGVLLGFALPFTRNRELVHQNRLFFTLLLTNAIAFILLIGIAQGRNSPHYILTSYVSLNLLAALGWLHAFQWIAARFSAKSFQIQYAGLIMILLLQIWSALSFFPYYFTYRNPILQSVGWYANYPQKPYGEGLELAADYLTHLPNAAESTALVYYSRGCFSYYYPGRSVSFRPYYVDGDHAIDLLRNLKEADYLVVYYANQVQLKKYDAYLDILSMIEPIHVIWMDGYEYVRIYKIDTFTPEILKALENL